MSGIVGIWNLDGRPVENAVLGRVSAALEHRGPDGEGRWIQGPVGLACQLFRVTPESATETQPFVDRSGAVVVFDGRLDNRKEILSHWEKNPGIAADISDPALVLAAYSIWGDNFAKQLNGDFALGLFDPARRQLLLTRDAIGIRPLYYWRTRNTVIFASEIKGLLAHPEVTRRPNDNALANLLLCDLNGGGEGETFFDGVQSLLPGQIVLVRENDIKTRRYWDFDGTRPLRLGSFREYVEGFRHYFGQAVRRRLRSMHPVAVTVSGGLDSSSIFCVAETLRQSEPGNFPRLVGVSTTYADGTPADEKMLLTEIEQKYGLTIDRLRAASPGFMDGCREKVWHVETPHLDTQWNTTRRLLRHPAAEHGARVLLMGHWGDHLLSDQVYLIDLFRQLAWGKIRAHLKEFPRWMTDARPGCFRDRFFHDLVRFLVPEVCVPLLRRMRSLFGRAAPSARCYAYSLVERARRLLPPLSKAQSLSLHWRAVRSRRNMLVMETFNKLASMHGLEMAFPYMDRDLVSYLLAIPGEMITWKGVPKALLREAMRGVLPLPIVERCWKADFTAWVDEGVQWEFPKLSHCLEAGGMVVKWGYVDADAMEQELGRLKKQLKGGTNKVSKSLSNLLGLELWLQVFFGNEPKPIGSPTHEPGKRKQCQQPADSQLHQDAREEAVCGPAFGGLRRPQPSHQGKSSKWQ
jgi:asparagine synthase (glutamine-hydrolysing)